MNQNNFINLKDIEFETNDKDRKGLQTEDAALRLLTQLARSLKIDILRRVIPPKDSGVNECDAILFSDIGLFLIEVKRYGGLITKLDETSDTIEIVQGDNISSRQNPIPYLVKRSSQLSEFLNKNNEWYKVKKLFEISGKLKIPVYSVLCFGPSTKIEEQIVSESVIVGNTRTIKNQLLEFIQSKNAVLGIGMHSKNIASSWHIQGKITVTAKAGFLRAYPVGAIGQVVSFSEVTRIDSVKGGKISITYADKVKKSSKLIEGIVFNYQTKSITSKILGSKDVTFTWKSGG